MSTGVALLPAGAQNQVNQNVQPPFTFQNTPSLVLDTFTGHLVAAYNDDPWMNGAQGIGASFSPDGGITWIDCPPLASVWGFWEADPSVVSDQVGSIYAGMASCDQIAPGGVGTPINSGIFVYVSTDGGQAFPAMNAVSVQSGIAPNTPWETKPKLEVDDDPTSPYHGRVYAIWERDLPIPNPLQWQYSDAWFAWSPPGGAAWGVLPTPLNDGTPFDEVLWPDLAVAPLGDVVAAWLDSPVAVSPQAPQGQIWFDRSTDGGQTFGPDVPVTTFWTVPGMMTDFTGQPTRSAMSYASVEVDPSDPNHVGIVYAADPDTGPITDARVDLGDLPPGNSDAWLVNPFHGTYNIDGSTQYAHAVWTDQRGVPREVFYNRATTGLLNWSVTDQLLSTQPPAQKQDANNANILCDGASNVYAAWDQWNGIDFTHTIYFNRSTNEGAPGSWLPQAINLDHLYRAAAGPMLSCDRNNVCAAWIVAGVDAQHTDLYINYSADAGATWQNPEIPVRTGQWILAHHIAQSGSHVYLVWQEATAGGGSAIYFSRSTNYGAPPWSTPIQLSSATAADILFAPKICCELGDVHVTWVDTRNGLYDPYFTWSNNYGAAGSWSLDVPINDQVTPGTSREYFSQIACGYGNVYVVYESDRSQIGASTEEIWINCSIGGGANWIGEQRLDLGDPPAPVIGRHSCHPRLVVGGTDLDAQVYVTWMDDRNSPVVASGYDIYGNHTLDGGVTWQASDYRIDIGDQPGQSDSWYPHAGWAGGPYFVWRDMRNGQGDVYANLFFLGPDEGDIFYIESFDGGATWNHPPLRVNDDPAGIFVDQSHPWLDFKPDGTVDVVWYDNRNDPVNDIQVETYFAALHPGAGAFAANLPIAPPMLPVTTWNWTGDYIWIDVDPTIAHVAMTGSWTDPTNGDVFHTWVENPPPPPQPGACCVPGRGCEFTTETECLALGGDFLGEGIPCDPDPCTDGVCCLGRDCSVVTEVECGDLAGVWHPERDDCDPNPCGGDYADHDVGNCVLTVTDMGILGFTDGTQAEGTGLVYPWERPGENRLFLGGLWVGLDPAYVANRDYDSDPAREWQVSTDPDGHIWIDYDGTSDQDMTASYTDGAAASPRGLFVQQESWAFSRAGNQVMDDFVILHYRVTNSGETLQEDVYVGLFLDLDIADYTSNLGWADPSLNLVWMRDGAEPPEAYVGLRLLQDELGMPLLSNISLIDNATYVYPQEHILDVDKYGFLSAAGPQYTLHDTTGFGAADYGVVAAAGPFDLGPGDSQTVSLAIIGGETLEQFLQNAHVAQLVHEKGPSEAPPSEESPPEPIRLLAARPNPFTGATVIRFVLPRASRVDLDIYDLGGRQVRRLLGGSVASGAYDLPWDGRDSDGHRVGSGVYFLRLRTDLSELDQRLVIIR